MLGYDASISAKITDRRSIVEVVAEEAASHLESPPCSTATDALKIGIESDYTVSSVSSPPDESHRSRRLTLTQAGGEGQGKSQNHKVYTFFDSAALLTEPPHSSTLVFGRRGTLTSKI